MNSANDPSQITPLVKNSSDLSQIAESSVQVNTNDSNEQSLFATAPLETTLGETPKLMEEMTEQELREFLQNVQQNRNSAQTFRASVSAKAERDKEQKASKQVVAGFEDLV